MRMADAAQSVLRQSKAPMSVREIHEQIASQGLFTFKAKDPVSVLGSAIRRRCKGSRSLRGEPLFERGPDGRYRLHS